MPVYIDNRIISLNSANAILNNGTYLSNVLFPFQGILSDEDTIVRSYVALVDAQIPCSFYIIDSTNNTLLVFSSGTLYTCVIASGNYTVNTLITAVNDWFLLNASGFAYLSFNKTNGKLSFNFQVISTVYLTYGSARTTMATILGLSTNITGLVSELQNPANLLGVKRITVKSDALQVESFSSAGYSSGGVLATINVNVPQFNMITYENSSDLNKLILNTKLLNGIDIELFDELGNFINFNGVNWSMSIVLSLERRYEDVSKPKLTDVLAAAKRAEEESLGLISPDEEITPKTQNELDLELLMSVVPPTEGIQRMEV